MIEPIMYLAIGFLVSMLFGLMIVPLVHNRAVRLTTKRLEAATPLSMAEIQADKDQLRAEFAMSARRLEMSVDQLKNKTTSQLAELGKKTDAINRMKIELGEKNATIFSLEAREKAVKEQLRATEEEFTAKTEALRDAEQALKDKQSELAKTQYRTVRPFDDGGEPPGRAGRGARPDRRTEEPRRRRRKGIRRDAGPARAGARRIREGDARTRRGAQPRRKPEPARHRSRSPADRPGQGSRDARQPRQRSGGAACHPGQAAGRARLREQPAAPGQRGRRAHRQGTARRNRRHRQRQIAGAGKAARARRRRSRNSSASRATSAPNCSATSTRSSSRPKAPGRPSAWKTRCCASASTISPPKSPNLRCSSKGRIRRSRPCWPPNRRSRQSPQSLPTALRPMARPPTRCRRPEGGGTLAERIRALQSHASRARQQQPG